MYNSNNFNPDDLIWFVSNYYRLLDKYGVSYVVVKDQSILYHAKDFCSAIKWATNNGLLNSALIQRISGDESAYTAYLSYLQSVLPTVVFTRPYSTSNASEYSDEMDYGNPKLKIPVDYYKEGDN